MKAFFLFITGILLLVGCKSSNQPCHKCPYESRNVNIQAEQPAVRLLAADSLRVNISGALPLKPVSVFGMQPPAGFPAGSPYKNIIDKAFEYEGVRYRRGGTSMKGMDCSGLVYTCFQAHGIMLPRSSFDMSQQVCEISRSEAKTGDLIFFITNRRRNRINHVGIVVEALDSEIKFIHASVRRGVIISSTQEDYYARSFVKIGRIARS